MDSKSSKIHLILVVLLMPDLSGLKIVFGATFLFACIFFLIAGFFKVAEACCGVCAHGNGERPVRTSKGYGTRSVSARLKRGAVDQKKFEAKLAAIASLQTTKKDK